MFNKPTIGFNTEHQWTSTIIRDVQLTNSELV